MKRIAMIALAASAALSMIEPASAREPVPPRWTAYGSAVCPSNYQYYQGWCHWVPRGRYGDSDGYGDSYSYGESDGYGDGGDYGYRRHHYGRVEGYAGDVVPPHWNYLGSAVCPSNYAYEAYVNACVWVPR